MITAATSSSVFGVCSQLLHRDGSFQWTGDVHDHLVRNARFPWNDRRAFDRARRLELRSAVASAVSAELRARDARNAQGAMTKKSPSEKEKSETVRARVADEATMVAMPVIVRAARAAASLHAQERIANDEDDVVVLLRSATSRSRPVRRSHRFPPPYLADAHEGRHGGWRRSSPGPSASGSHSRGRYSSGGVHGGLGASSRGPARRPRRVRVFLKTDALPALTPPPPSPKALKNFCREGDQINVLHVIPKCVSSNLSRPFRASPLFLPSVRSSRSG